MNRTLHYPYQPDVVHAEGVLGEYDTLCGHDPDPGQNRGSVPTGNSVFDACTAVYHKRRRLVTCEDCAALIRASRAYRVSAEVVAPQHFDEVHWGMG